MNAHPPFCEPGTRRAGLDTSMCRCTPRLPRVPPVCGAWRVSEPVAPRAVGTSPLHLLVCRVPMGRQRGPPVPRWRQLLRAGCWRLLSLSGTVLRGLRWLWRLVWYLLFCYKSCWDGAFQVTEELGVVLQANLESGSQGSEEEEEQDGGSTSVLEPGQAVAERRRCGDASEAVLERLEALEADVRFLCTELGAEKLLWSSRFLELLREQQGLRQRLQERPRRWDSGDSPKLLGEAEDQSASGSEGESLAARQWMEPRWQPAPCPGSLLGPAASRQAENCQPGPAPSCPILPSPACSAELQPVPRSRNQPGGSSGQAAVSWAAQGRSQSPLARGHPWD
ncbi:uncharacterized protein LOC115351655 isoform X2 [Aquila chrysaetos chrysaetos]|uniref:uncharacterized protein LOC115351655 isoform X2 n=1 Tax=Aquila chrysaetos chrysaetos TaxID=223781 RepID=UPI0005D06F5C|nr:uncharacterized protein LOC115351655 isoform X2 [Aquila chrysaetos chrysaetos]